jgi:two-component system phosphate regulon sensor histidine kinase PhoR
MIDIPYRKILFFQGFFLFILGLSLYYFFKQTFNLAHISSSIKLTYISVWILFITSNLLFIRFFALPTKSFLKKLDSSPLAQELSWSEVEDSLIKRDIQQQSIASEYEVANLRFKVILDSLLDPVCIFNNDQVILYSNHAFEGLFSLTNNASNISLLEITRNLYFQDFVKKSISTNDEQKLSEFSFDQIQDSFKKHFEIKILPLKNTSTYLCIMHDVTERKMVDQVREDFISNFSHEVRTPLTILTGQMQFLKSELEKNNGFTVEHAVIFEKIDRNSKRLINLFQDMLTLSSVERSKDLVKEEIDIEPMLYGLLDEISQNYSDKKINLNFDLRTKTFFIDYRLFEQVLINLIDNAYKYLGISGNIVVTSYTDAENAVDILEISDDGMGIPENQLHRIFERFFRIDSSRSHEIAGTGLGLSIVKHIIQKHDGKIKVVSKENAGTTFIISLPMKA